ncbi:hypothetical protein LQ948_04085 [Jiella sp. MQZ9-1]|uniref:Uncharacterized protein n=1 Tax=Jiella flava TaxID=2816857 RepID=A0A939FY92_9HYPH|nr:hypothetical protein [Jiella flava]MBO0661742.1 hypothetical protein [Jiella flava]MCD2470383.1 hypothetical protein [Jiella flava]
MSLVERSGLSQFRAERQEYRMVFAVTFPIFFTVALVSRLLPARLRPTPFGQSGVFAVFRDAKAAAHSVLPYAFMR